LPTAGERIREEGTRGARGKRPAARTRGQEARYKKKKKTARKKLESKRQEHAR
jgi:hypothetical protein